MFSFLLLSFLVPFAETYTAEAAFSPAIDLSRRDHFSYVADGPRRNEKKLFDWYGKKRKKKEKTVECYGGHRFSSLQDMKVACTSIIEEEKNDLQFI